MAFALPAPNNNHNQGRGTSDPKWVNNLNNPSNPGTKAAGNLPITGVAKEFDGNTTNTNKGYVCEFNNGQVGIDVSVDTWYLLWGTQFNAPNRIQVGTVANGGVQILIYSGAGSPPFNYKSFYVGGRDTPMAECCKGQYPLIIDLASLDADFNQGTVDLTDITSYGILTRRQNMAGSATNWNYQQKLYLLASTKTSSSTPTFTGSSGPQDAVDLIQGFDYTDKLGNWVRKIGSVIFMDMGFRIGDNSTSTQFDDDGLVIISPQSNDPNDPRVRVTDQAFRTYLNLRNNAADTATFSGTWIWGTKAAFDWDQDDAAVVTFDSPTFIGMGPFTLGTSIIGPATWDSVDAVRINSSDVDVDGSSFKNTTGDHALELGNVSDMDLANMRFESYAGKHAILLESDGTYNLTDVFFDQSGTADIENDSGGLVTINVFGGTIPTVTNSDGTSVVNVSFSHELTGMQSNSEVTYVRVSDQFELFHVENVTGTGVTEYTYNYTTDETVDILIHHQDYESIALENVVLSNADQSIPVTQTFDRNYTNP